MSVECAACGGVDVHREECHLHGTVGGYSERTKPIRLSFEQRIRMEGRYHEMRIEAGLGVSSPPFKRDLRLWTDDRLESALVSLDHLMQNPDAKCSEHRRRDPACALCEKSRVVDQLGGEDE